MSKPDKLNVIMAAIAAIGGAFIVVVIVLVVLSAVGLLPESWRSW